jgi:hypothetical protein
LEYKVLKEDKEHKVLQEPKEIQDHKGLKEGKELKVP